MEAKIKYKLSIIIPVYNVEKYIKRCLDSIYKQGINLEHYEVIVVNDGTPDNSMSIVNDFAKRYSNLKIINQENKGLSAARNIGLSLAKGEYVWFIDSDDWISNMAFELVLPSLDTNSEIIATNLIYAFDDNTRNFNERVIENNLYVNPRDYFNHYSIGASQRYLIRREYLTDINLYFTEGIYHEDAEFGAILIYNAKTIYVLKSNIYYYYQRTQGSIMSNWKLKNSTDYLKVFSNLEKFQKNYVLKENKDFFSWYLFRLLIQAFPAKYLKDKNEILNFYINVKDQLRRDAFSCLNFKNIKRVIAILLFMISPLVYIKLLSAAKKND